MPRQQPHARAGVRGSGLSAQLAAFVRPLAGHARRLAWRTGFGSSRNDCDRRLFGGDGDRQGRAAQRTAAAVREAARAPAVAVWRSRCRAARSRAMGKLSSTERAAAERAAAEPMLDQLLAWSAVNSGSRNLAGLERKADLLVDAFSALPGVLRLEAPHPLETGDAAGRTVRGEHGRPLHLNARPTAPMHLPFT